MRYLNRSEIAFAQAEGVESLPRQLELKKVSQELRSAAWALIFKAIEKDLNVEIYGTPFLSEAWRSFFIRWEVVENKRCADEINYYRPSVIGSLTDVVTRSGCAQFYSTLEFIVRSSERLGVWVSSLATC